MALFSRCVFAVHAHKTDSGQNSDMFPTGFLSSLCYLPSPELLYSSADWTFISRSGVITNKNRSQGVMLTNMAVMVRGIQYDMIR